MSHLPPFRLGVLPSLAGIYFNGDDLLARLQPAPAELRPALVTLSEKVSARGRETIDMVLECERLVMERGRPSPGRPRTPADYRAWAEAVSRDGRALFIPSVSDGALFLLGLGFGDLVLTLVLEGLVAELLTAAPGHDLLARQAAALAADGERARASLKLASSSVGMPASAEAVLERLRALLDPAQENGHHAALADELLALRPDLERSLAAG